VIIGPERTRTLFAVLVYGALLVIVVFAAAGWTPLPTALAGTVAPYATAPVRIVYRSVDGPALVRALKMTARLHLWVGLLLAAGVLI
jgi:1,4-dihydroxy-2-naphthoate octaprenyltransferase